MTRNLFNCATAAVIAGLVATPTQAAFDWQRFQGSEITVLMAEHPVTNGVRTLLDQFQSETGIKVNLQALAEDLYFDRMEIALRGDAGKAAMDVYFLPMDSTAYSQYKADLVKPLSPYLEDPDMTAADYAVDDFPAGFLNATAYPPDAVDKDYYGIPVSFEAYILFYNQDHVNQYLDGQVPATMDELLAAAATVKETSNGTVAGAVMRGIRSDTLIDTVTGIVYNSWGLEGVQAPYNVWFDGDWSKPRLDDPKIAKGLANYAGLMQAGPVNIQAIDWPEASQLFQMGRAAFFIDASLFGPGFEDASQSRVAGKTGYAVIPPDNASGESYTAHWMWGLGIPANAANPDAGWYFIQWMTNQQHEPAIGKLHGGAARQSTWQNADYASAFNPEYVSAVGEAMKTSRSSVVFREGWSEFALRIIDTIQAIYQGETPAQASAAAQADFKAKLGQ